MAWASLLSGMSIALAGTGLGHAMAEIVGGRTHIPHGLAVAAFLPAVLQLLEEDCGLSLQRLKRALGDVDVPAHSRIRELWRGAGLPTTLDDLKVSRGLIDEVRHATLTDAAWAMAPNPVHLGGEDIDRVLAYVWPDEINQGVSHSPR
jgi:alcohol dehydrogenase class IV